MNYLYFYGSLWLMTAKQRNINKQIVLLSCAVYYSDELLLRRKKKLSRHQIRLDFSVYGEKY